MATLNTREPQFWFTHLYLVAALCISYAIDLKYLLSQSRLLPVSPHIVLVLMAADAMAALFGLKYGKRRMFKNKTWVGYLAFVLTYCIGASLSSLLYPFNFQLSVLLNQLQSNLIYHLSIGLVLGVVEVFSGDLDNISTLGAFWMMRYVWLWSDLYS